MGKFARVIARVQDVSTEPVGDAGKFLGRTTKNAALAIKNKAHEARVAVQAESDRIDAERAQERQEREEWEAMMEASRAEKERLAKAPAKKAAPVKKAASSKK